MPSWNQVLHLELEQLISWPIRGYVAPKGNITQRNRPASCLRGIVNNLLEQGFGIYRSLVLSLALSPSQSFCSLIIPVDKRFSDFLMLGMKEVHILASHSLGNYCLIFVGVSVFLEQDKSPRYIRVESQQHQLSCLPSFLPSSLILSLPL